MSTYEPQDTQISLLKNHPRNYRRHPEDQIDHLVMSITEHGFYRAVVATQDGTILAGHGIVAAAKRMGLTSIPVVVLPIEPDSPQALKVLTGDNELGRLAEIDDRALTEILKEIKDSSELLGTGFDANMLANLVMVTRDSSEVADFDEAAHWVGMPDYVPKVMPSKLVVLFESDEIRKQFIAQAGLNVNKSMNGTISCWWPDRGREDPSSIEFREE
jgi:hypothetical protein